MTWPAPPLIRRAPRRLMRRQRKRRGRAPCQDPPEVVLTVVHRSTAWFTRHPWDNHANPHSSRATTRSSSSSNSTTVLFSLCNSREQLGRHSKSRQWGTRATIMRRLGTSPRNAACQGRPTHLVHQLIWLTSRRASREAQRSVLAASTTPPWRRYPRERKFLQVHSSSTSTPS
jgi:hypothetical protein